MKRMPHPMDVSHMRDLLALALDQINEGEPKTDSAFREDDASFFAAQASYCFSAAFATYFFEGETKDVLSFLRGGLLYARTAYQLGASADRSDAELHFHAALLLSDHPTAHFLASMPESLWWEPWRLPAPAEVVRLQAAFALFRQEPVRLSRALDDLEALAAELDSPQTRNAHQLFQSVSRADSRSFHAAMAKRIELREQELSVNGSEDWEGLIDVVGLGLCRLAMRAGLSLSLRHVYLPLELLTMSDSTRENP